MSYRGSEFPFFDFSGGLATNKPASNIEPNEAQNLRNLLITVGKGIQKKQGNTTFNSTAMASGAAVTGLFYFKLLGGSDFLVAAAGSSIFKSDALDGTMDDITGAVVVTSNQNNLWTASQMNDLAIFVGGAPNPPFKYSGTGNAADLGGTPPSGTFGFSHNNRMFIGNTAANPSLISWSTLGNPEDWSGTGSGSQQIEKNDGDVLVGAAPINIDNVVLFKQNSIHTFLTRTSPFPYYPIFKGVGAVGKRAIVTVDGMVYFITADGQMRMTDGSKVYDQTDFPRLGNIDDIWASLNQSRLQYITGFYESGVGYDHVVWLCSSASSSTNDLALVWDIRNKCWLRHTQGYKANSAARTQSGIIYTGHYDGKIYKQGVTSEFNNASETAPGAIDSYWGSCWHKLNSLTDSFKFDVINVALTSQTSGFLTIGYGFNYVTDAYTESKSMQAAGDQWDAMLWDQGIWGGQGDVVKNIFTKGRGINAQVSFRNNNAGETFTIHGYSFLMKKTGRKIFSIR